MRVRYYDSTRQVQIGSDEKLIDLDSAAARYFCGSCRGSLTVQRVSGEWRLWCPACKLARYSVVGPYAPPMRPSIKSQKSPAEDHADLFG